MKTIYGVLANLPEGENAVVQLFGKDGAPFAHVFAETGTYQIELYKPESQLPQRLNCQELHEALGNAMRDLALHGLQSEGVATTDPDGSVTLTLKQGYLAMYSWLAELYGTGAFDQLGGLLGSMSLLSDGVSADAAIWADWQAAVARANAGAVSADLEIQGHHGGRHLLTVEETAAAESLNLGDGLLLLPQLHHLPPRLRHRRRPGQTFGDQETMAAVQEVEIERGAIVVEVRSPGACSQRRSGRIVDTELPFQVHARVLVIDAKEDEVPPGTQIWSLS